MIDRDTPRFARGSASPRRLPSAAVTAVAVLCLPVLVGAGSSRAVTDSIAASELKRAAERGELCSATNATGTGLRGEYFSKDAKRSTPLLVRVDPTIDFDASMEWPSQLAGERPGVVRWSGWVKPPIAGRYRFHVGQPHSRVTVARTVVVGDGAAADASIEMAAGRYYPITVEVRGVDAMSDRVKLEWTAPYGARYVVPRALLFVPSESAPPGRS